MSLSRITPEAYASEISRYHAGPRKKHLRLGQHLMNSFSVGHPDPEVFYEKDNDKAASLFSERYVEGFQKIKLPENNISPEELERRRAIVYNYDVYVLRQDEDGYVPKEDFERFIYTIPNEPRAPLAVKPTSEDTRRLGPGAVVAVYFGRLDTKLPFIIRLSRVDVTDFCYHTTGNINTSPMVLDHPMIYYDPKQTPGWEENNRSIFSLDLDGFGWCNAAHVIKIYDFGQPIPRHQNRLYEQNQKNIARQIKISRRDKMMRESIRRRKIYEGHSAWNESYRTSGTSRTYHVSDSTTRGVYNGNLFELVKATLIRNPSLQIRTDVNSDRFWDLYTSSGKFGWVGDYYNFFQNYEYNDDGERVQKAPHPLYGKVNIKAFRQWVLKNYKKMLYPLKEYEQFRMNECRQAEIGEMKTYLSDLDYDNRQDNQKDLVDEEDLSDIDNIYDY